MSVAIVAQGARSQLLLKKQSALGVVATGNFTRLRYNTHSLNVAKDMIEANEIRGDREVYDARHGNRSARGDIAVDLTFGDHDALIESIMFNPFDTDSVQIGVAPQYLSIEDGALDIAQYRMFESMVGNTMQLSIRPNQMVTATFGMIGLDGGAPAGSSSGGTPVAPTTNSPFDSFNGALYDNAEESGNEVAVVTSLELNVDNGVNPAFAVGQQTPIFLEFGRGRVSGTLTAFYQDASWLTRFLNETESPLVMNITDPDGNVMEFRMPRVKFSGGDVPVANEQSRIITMPFIAMKDEVIGSALKISKV